MEVLCFLPSTNYPLYDFDLRATHARTLLPAALASVSFGFLLVRVRVRYLLYSMPIELEKYPELNILIGNTPGLPENVNLKRIVFAAIRPKQRIEASMIQGLLS